MTLCVICNQACNYAKSVKYCGIVSNYESGLIINQEVSYKNKYFRDMWKLHLFIQAQISIQYTMQDSVVSQCCKQNKNV